MANKPYVVVEWNDTETDAKGWMCAYNFVGHYLSLIHISEPTRPY